LNVIRQPEPVAGNIVYADVPAVDDGSTAAILFVGCNTSVSNVYGIKSDKQFINTLEDNIRDRGAPSKLISDRAQVKISKAVQDILCILFIPAWQSEPHQQQQNPSERRYQYIKTTANRVMDRTGAPEFTWLLCLQYVCFLLNHVWDETLKGIPITLLTGITTDISVLLRFFFWQKVYFKRVESKFPSKSTEVVGHIVGISEHVGHTLTWKILTSDTKKVVYRSIVRPYSDSDPNLCADLLGGEKDPTKDPNYVPIIKSHRLLADGESKHNSTPDVDQLLPQVETVLPENEEEDGHLLG